MPQSGDIGDFILQKWIKHDGLNDIMVGVDRVGKQMSGPQCHYGFRETVGIVHSVMPRHCGAAECFDPLQFVGRYRIAHLLGKRGREMQEFPPFFKRESIFSIKTFHTVEIVRGVAVCTPVKCYAVATGARHYNKGNTNL